MSSKKAKAGVLPVRQRTQYSCMAASMMMCLKALGHVCDEDEVNNVMGATPMKGAAWEQALATAQHYGCRATLTVPATVTQLKEWTDKGIPVMIAWNPEGREWSHASVVFDVDEEGNVHVADPNIPDPEETVRVVPKAEFYKMWYEKWPRYLVRRPALAVEREITPDGRQVMAKAAAHPRDLKSPGFHEWAKSYFEIIWRDEGIEARLLKDAVEMYAWETGYAGENLEPWFVELGRLEGVDVRKEHRHGQKDGQESGYRAAATHRERKAMPTKTDSTGQVWGPKRGLEGPFKYRSGIVLYWDPREGHYWNPSTDIYLYDDRDFFEATGEFWDRKASASRVASRVRLAGVELHKGIELVALKDVSVGFPVASGRGRTGILRAGSRIRVNYATSRGDVFAGLLRGDLLMQEDDGALTPVPDASFALGEGHRTRHPYDMGFADDRVWKVG